MGAVSCDFKRGELSKLILSFNRYGLSAVQLCGGLLEEALERQPTDQEVLLGLISFHRDGGSLQAAIRYARRLVEASGRNPQALDLLRRLENRR